MNIKTNAYLAVGYACNQKCRCCPITNNINKDELLAPWDRIKEEANLMVLSGVTDVTISGGEPTIHPDFFKIIELFLQKNIGVHILSNGEKFSDKSFCEKFLEISGGKPVYVTTTFHSFYPEAHELQNQSKGSFARSLEGLKRLDSNGVNIAIKHCITANNYRELPQYLEWVLSNFSSNAEIQLWGIDICGISDALAQEMYVEYKKIGVYIEEALDLFEKHPSSSNRVLTINNLPLCMCNSYYWAYFTPPEADNYIEHMQGGRKMDAISGPASRNCNSCKFRAYCPGVYYSNFDLFGDEIVAQPVKESRISSFVPRIVEYSQQTINLTYFSPYSQIQLHPTGFRLWNTRLGEYVLIRIKTEQMSKILSLLDNGIRDEALVEELCSIGVDGESVIRELMLKGIIE